jgi:aminoglycoside phosphotransferase (APT) family kinase protein
LQFRKGHSNLTYHLQFGEQEYVLRRPPFGNPVKSAHDMGREFRVLSKLCEVYPPAPRPFVYCQDASIIGDEFYVMERRHGIVLRSASAPELSAQPGAMRKLCESLVDNLVALHSLDYRAAGLGDLGHPEGYIERQVTGWNKRYVSARTEECPDLESLGEWLMQHRPADGPPAFLHNDYKYDNLMLDPRDLTRIVAVLDWEMATVGDPLMDLGMTLAYWVQADDSEDQRSGAFGPTALPGSFTRRDVVAHYSERAGKGLPNMLFYYGFGLFKLAVIIQQIYARFARGLTQDPRFAGLNSRVRSLGAAGRKAIESGEI